jgi:membrane-associated protein
MFVEYFSTISQPEQVLVGAGSDFGMIVYLLIFLLVFCETGLVIAAPFCPGDTLLFICGILIGTGFLDPVLVLVAISVAAIAGDSVNYKIGRYLGMAFLSGPGAGIIRPEWIQGAHNYFIQYGGFTIVIGRYIPYLRSLAPFMAGVGDMNYHRFLMYNITGGIFWTCTVVGAGFFLGRTFLESGYSFLAEWMLILSVIIAALIAMYAMYAFIRHHIPARK